MDRAGITSNRRPMPACPAGEGVHKSSAFKNERTIAFFVLAFAAVLFTARLGTRSLWSEEVRWVQIPREMEQSGRWFWPTFNGQTYYDKPLASYWLVLLA